MRNLIKTILFPGISVVIVIFIYTIHKNETVNLIFKSYAADVIIGFKYGKITYKKANKSQFHMKIDSKTFQEENIVTVSPMFLNNTVVEGFQREANFEMLSAITQSQHFIMELDPDCTLINTSETGLHRLASIIVEMKIYRFGLTSIKKENKFLNPYSVFGPNFFLWPRGIPIDISEHSKVHFPQLVRASHKITDRAVVFQSCISGFADIATARTNFEFKPLPMSHMVVSNDAMVPYNKMATIYKKEAFWSLYLPVTVPYKVADIWRAYISQAIFKVVGFYVVFISPLVKRNIDKKKENIEDQVEDEKLHLLVDTLNKWVHSNRNLDNCDIAQLFISVYSDLVKNHLLDRQEMEDVNKWIIQLREVNYDFTCHVVSTMFEEGMSEGQNVDTLNVFGAIYMEKSYYQNIGLVHAFYSGIYKEPHIFIGEVQRNSACVSPLPQKSTCMDTHDIPDDGLWYKYKNLVSYKAYLLALDQLRGRSDAEDVPTTLIWHHDDMLLNFTTILRFLRDENKYFGAMPSDCDSEDFADYPKVRGANWSLTTEKKTEEWFKSDDYYPRTPCVHFPLLQPILQQLLNEGTFFNEPGSECYKVYTERGYKIKDLSRFTIKMMSDVIMTKWNHPKLANFHKKLKILLDRGMMLEYAIPLAFRCSLPSDEIDKNFSWGNFCEISYWDERRNDVATMEMRMRTASQDLYHPHKMAVSIKHLDAVLKWRTNTFQTLNNK